MFYAKLDSVLDQCPSLDTLIVLGHFNVVTGTKRVGYELCVPMALVSGTPTALSF